MSVFGDTSAFYPLLVRSDADHDAARTAFTQLLKAARPIWTTSFVLVETMALLQHRIGLSAARDFDEEIVPVLNIAWADDDLYRRAMERLWREDRRKLSLADCAGFELMKRKGLSTAFAIDPHFTQAGFTLLPAQR